MRNASCATRCVMGQACAQRVVSWGGPCAQRVVSRGRVCAQRVVSWGPALRAARCVTGAGRHVSSSFFFLGSCLAF